jgi:ankyrin repeat protein
MSATPNATQGEVGAGSTGSKMSAEEKNARMTEERAFLTKLLESSLQGKLNVVKELVNDYLIRNPSVSKREILEQFKDGKKRTALYFICQSDNPTILEDLFEWLRKDMDAPPRTNTNIDNNDDFSISWLKLKDSNGMTALMVCAQHPNPQLAYRRVKFLLELQLAVSGTPQKALHQQLALALARSKVGAGALHYAAGAGALPETIQLLVQAAKVQLSTASLKGGMPLHWAASTRENHISTLEALVQAGADLNAKDENGLTPLLLAAAAGNDAHAKYLVQQGADIAVEFPGQITIFHIAADCNLVSTLAALLEQYPESNLIHQPNSRGEAPIDLAVQEEHVGCVMLLTGEGDETKANAWLEEHKKNLPARHQPNDEASSKPLSKDEPLSPITTGSGTGSYSLLEEQAKELGAKAAAAQVTDEDKKRATDLKLQGNQLYSKNKWELAIQCYTEAIGADPTDATFYSNRAACWMQIKKYDDALQDAVICRLLKPEWTKACYRMAAARLALHRYEDAALSAWEGLRLDEDNDELKRMLQKCVKEGRKVHKKTAPKDHDTDDE